MINYFIFKNNCTLYLDRNTITGPYFNSLHQVQTLAKKANYSLSTDRSKTISAITPYQYDFFQGESLQIMILTGPVPVDFANFSYGIPLYSPVDKKCEVQ